MLLQLSMQEICDKSSPSVTVGFQRLSLDKRGDLNGSMQHLLTVFINAVYEADFVRGRQSKQSKALVRF
jgi:hypothetical protein